MSLTKPKQIQGYGLIEMLLVIVIASALLAWAIKFITEQSKKAQARGPVATHIGNVVSAVRTRLSMENASADFPSASQARNGLSWLKGPSCSGGAPEEILPCNVGSEIPHTGGLGYYTQINNSSGTLSAEVTVRTPSNGTYSVSGGERHDLMGIAVKNAMGGVGINGATSPSGVSSFMTAEVNPDTGIAVITVDTDPTNQPFLRVDGQNSMNADLGFSGAGSDINNAQDVNARRFRDLDNGNVVDPSNRSTFRHATVTNDFRARYLRDQDNPNYIVDPSGTSTLNRARAQSIQSTNAAFNAANVGRLNADEINASTTQSDISLSRVFFDKDNRNYYLDMDGDSRLRDIYLASRGNTRLSELLPNWVLKDSVLRTSASPNVAKPNCGTNGTEALVVIPQSAKITVKDGMNSQDESVVTFKAIDNGSTWRLVCETPDNNTNVLSGTDCDALAHLYCVYP